MSELRRLTDGHGDELELALLRSADTDAPSRRSKRRAMAALGIGGALAASAVTTTVAKASTVTTSVAGAAAKATGPAAALGAGQAALGAGQVVGAKAALVVLVKWAGVATVAGLTTLTAADRILAPPAPESAVPTSTQSASAPIAGSGNQARVGAGQPEQAPQISSALTAEGPPTAEPPSGSAVAAAQSGAPAPAAAPSVDEPGAPGGTAAKTLRAEVESLDDARSAVQSGRANDALRALERHERDFGGGTLGPEAELLRIEVLARMGRMAEARARASAFLARDPTSPYAQRVRSLVESAP